MTEEKIARLNFLARLAKGRALTEAEKDEQARLRWEYRQSVVGNLKRQLGALGAVEKKSGAGNK